MGLSMGACAPSRVAGPYETADRTIMPMSSRSSRCSSMSTDGASVRESRLIDARFSECTPDIFSAFVTRKSDVDNCQKSVANYREMRKSQVHRASQLARKSQIGFRFSLNGISIGGVSGRCSLSMQRKSLTVIPAGAERRKSKFARTASRVSCDDAVSELVYTRTALNGKNMSTVSEQESKPVWI